MVSQWLSSVEHLQTSMEPLVPAFCQSALSLLWPYYVHSLAKPSLPGHVLQMYHMGLAKVAWHRYWPDIQAVQLMLKVRCIHDQGLEIFYQIGEHLDKIEMFLSQVHDGGYPSSCCEFLGQVVTSLRWGDIVHHYVSHDIADIVQQLHTSLFTLLVQLSTHTVLLEVGIHVLVVKIDVVEYS